MSEKDTIEMNASTQEEEIHENVEEEKVDEKKEKFNETIEKGQNIADKVANDLSKGVDEFFVNVKSAQKKLNDKVSDYKKSNGTLSINLIEDSEKYYIKVATPGVNKEDIEIEAGDYELAIEVDFPSFNDEVEAEEDAKVLLEELKEGKCAKSITFDKQIDITEIKAAFNHGITIIEIPKVKAPKQKVTVE